MTLEQDKVYNNAQLAEWFQISQKTFSNSKKKKLQYLEEFAKFEEIKGKVKILEVYEAEYVNPRDKKNNNKLYRQDIEAVIKEQPLQMFKTCAGRLQLLPDSKTKKLNHKFNTAYKYTRENLRAIANGNERFWCERHYNEAVDFTILPEQQLLDWQDIIAKHLGDKNKADLIASWKSQAENGELTKEEYDYNIDHIIGISWEEAKIEFCEQYGFVPVSVAHWQLVAQWNEEELEEDN